MTDWSVKGVGVEVTVTSPAGDEYRLPSVTHNRYGHAVIRSFADRRTEALSRGEAVQGVPTDVSKRAVNELFLLDSVTCLDDLRVPPGNRLEALSGGRSGQHSIRVDDQWRICFTWTTEGVHDVAFVDCH